MRARDVFFAIERCGRGAIVFLAEAGKYINSQMLAEWRRESFEQTFIL
jgi:hypothetical protein